jgi:hypothetical protein
MVIHLLDDQKGIAVKKGKLFKDSIYSNAKFKLGNHEVL